MIRGGRIRMDRYPGKNSSSKNRVKTLMRWIALMAKKARMPYSIRFLDLHLGENMAFRHRYRVERSTEITFNLLLYLSAPLAKR
jgi:hypothetical protein